jgi:hypothetical protein
VTLNGSIYNDKFNALLESGVKRRRLTDREYLGLPDPREQDFPSILRDVVICRVLRF